MGFTLEDFANRICLTLGLTLKRHNMHDLLFRFHASFALCKADSPHNGIYPIFIETHFNYNELKMHSYVL